MIKLHRFATTWLRLRPWHYQAPAWPRALRLLGLVGSSRWTEPVPQWSFVLETSDRLLVVDAGSHPDPGPFDAANQWFFERCFQVVALDPLSAQMRRAGLDPEAVDTILQTHLHFDHADGLLDFPQAQVLVQDREVRFHQARPEGSRPRTWHPLRFLRVEGDHAVAPGLKLLATPGHTPGHQSVWLEEPGVLLLGDLAFDEPQFRSGGLPGISVNLGACRRSRQRVLRCQGLREVWASHDPLDRGPLRTARVDMD